MNFWENVYVETAASYSVAVLCAIVFLAIFELVTSYNNWEQIRKGNFSVAMATGGKIFGISNIFHYSVQHNDSLLQMMAWGSFGFVLLLIGYFMFEFLTPSFRIDKEIEEDNRAVGFIAMVISVGLSFVIGANIL
ncbi:membrane protein [Pontibacillus halophilus JSM 076056 = DSM 19796]|uniref:Membrane protein n=1 Tax=Pontibacillus halophilus JSM 076056 = DSM 19796 TaxID=1385510 RepID=A0A0A5GQB2_9BACI|nr:membrane protein [Pontibacillus halophilus JSM 076056 = DSM 19796]